MNFSLKCYIQVFLRHLITLFHKLCSNSATFRLLGNAPANPVMQISSSADFAKILALLWSLSSADGSPTINWALSPNDRMSSLIFTDAMLICGWFCFCTLFNSASMVTYGISIIPVFSRCGSLNRVTTYVLESSSVWRTLDVYFISGTLWGRTWRHNRKATSNYLLMRVRYSFYSDLVRFQLLHIYIFQFVF